MFNTYFFHITRAEIIINKKMNKTVFDFQKEKKGTPATMLSFEKRWFAHRVFRKAQQE